MKKAVTIGLGSNQGDRKHYLQDAVARLQSLLSEPHYSGIYESPALLPEGAPKGWDRPFLNMAMLGHTAMTAEELLRQLQLIEHEMGRIKQGHWSPRNIDLDILTYEDEVVQTPVLTIPHPHMAQRDFVILPLAELIPDWQHPITKQTVRQMAEVFVASQEGNRGAVKCGMI